jgi:hypothetical protein
MILMLAAQMRLVDTVHLRLLLIGKTHLCRGLFVDPDPCRGWSMGCGIVSFYGTVGSLAKLLGISWMSLYGTDF